MSFEQVARLIGGVGLFLLGMRLMTDGLQVAAGRALREILSRSTRTRLRGIGSGFLMTSLVQSSSAITVATIGFVNAGLLNLSQALAITYGSNIGTTMTGWLVAMVGLQLDVKAFALPLIGLGMGLRVVVRGSRLGSLGEALAGFGVFFLGIDILRSAFEGLGDAIALGGISGEGFGRTLLFVGVGFLLTVLMQSSSAAIAIILTAAGGGVVPLGSAAALVIGANVGTTSTAALAVIGATPNAKRVAAGHVAFNALTGVVALLLLPVLLFAIVRGREALQLESEPTAVLAGFHTLFNLLGVALLWPLSERLVRFLEGRFRSHDEDEARPRYLDRNVVATPHLGLDAVVLELARVGQIARRIAAAALAAGDEARGAAASVASGRKALEALAAAVGEYIQMLHRARLPDELEGLPATGLRVSRYYSEAAELASMVVAGRPEGALPETLADELAAFVAASRKLVERAGIDREDYEAERVGAQLERLETLYQELKASLLDAGSRGELAVSGVVEILDWLSNVRRLTEQMERGARFLASIATHREADPTLEAPTSETAAGTLL